jgi:hypothetical protein
MNPKLKTLMLLATMAGLWMALPETLRAQEVLEKVSFSATVYEQNTNEVSTATTTTTKAPIKESVSTANLLKQLAEDEAFEGNLASATLPSGAVLNFNTSSGGFEIDKGTNVIVDVSDILTWTVSGQNDITSGSYSTNGAGMAPYNQTDYYLVTLAYNDSSATGVLTFSLTGLATVVQKATNPNVRTGNYTQSYSISFQDGTGEGMNQNGPLVVTGATLTASGSATFNTGNGTDENQ